MQKVVLCLMAVLLMLFPTGDVQADATITPTGIDPLAGLRVLRIQLPSAGQKQARSTPPILLRRHLVLLIQSCSPSVIPGRPPGKHRFNTLVLD